MRLFLFIIFFLISLPGFCQEGNQETGLPEPIFDASIELKKLGYDSINAKALLDKRVILIIKKMHSESHLMEASPSAVKALIEERFHDTYLKSFLLSHPGIYDLLVDILRDKEALMGLIDIALRQDDVKSFLHFWIAFLVAIWLLKKALFSKTWGLKKTMLFGLLVSALVTTVSVGVFYSTFKKELTPILEIISRHI